MAPINPPDYCARFNELVDSLEEEEDRLKRADEDVKTGGSKVSQAARDWKVSRYKLRTRLKGGHSREENGGNRTKLTSIEKLTLFAWISTQLSIGLLAAFKSLTTTLLIDAASKILTANGRAYVQTSRRWAKRTKSKAWVRKQAQRKDDLRRMFTVYRGVKRRERITPDNVWNGDGTGYRVGVVESGQVVWTYTDITVVESTNPELRDLVTVIEAISAAGHKVPPFSILPGQLLKVKHIDNTLDDGSSLTTSPSGYTDDQIALEWFDHWERNSRPFNREEERLLVLDNHGSHCTIEFFQRCVTANVILFLLPPHTTHLVKPLDVGIFQICKHVHQQHILKQVNYGVVDYGKENFLDGLRYIREKAMTKNNNESAWRKSGLSPWDPDLVISKLPDPLTSAICDDVIRNKPGSIASEADPETPSRQRR
ncbi:DDE-domain-containing protein [Parathielavia hyrcaniae]|uniref:DDE-domain-containing protein n=1 Tax=Parathielavia hyrcaniae TaxID=113614 RepID=A0AAN6PPR0_9PEZI|nr:DDE-domain-containing protein [Parathielavia hyrcaniae]